jgi:hypothetical protein
MPLANFVQGLPVPTLLVDGAGAVQGVNEAGADFLQAPADDIVGRLGGDVFECVHASLPGGCGATVHCSGCTIRRTVTRTHDTGEMALRVPATLQVRGPDAPTRVDLLITTARVGDQVLVRIDPPETRRPSEAWSPEGEAGAPTALSP